MGPVVALEDESLMEVFYVGRSGSGKSIAMRYWARGFPGASKAGHGRRVTLSLPWNARFEGGALVGLGVDEALAT